MLLEVTLPVKCKRNRQAELVLRFRFNYSQLTGIIGMGLFTNVSEHGRCDVSVARCLIFNCSVMNAVADARPLQTAY